ncbi:flavodoxin family protein [Bacteroides sp. 214]|uniref:NAD(P)H-dependent oxidoreductase n=1 Tax=Bacteroides sp. 214 TaxID=2302935 RepID=UPI0013D76409|nr:NAD(P)H-dependent oxidoreductase [Bacteroides sp. 214]NDW11417.1 flavodoxin family protein [Bacteroides sp. 214]
MHAKSGQVVILIAHPNLKESVVNKSLLDTVKDIEGVAVYNLYDEKFKEFNVAEWGTILSNASALVLQFPIHWMSAPYMMKRWEDEVLTYVSKTPAIAGKPLMVITTTGFDESCYRTGGKCQFTIDELLRPYQAAAIHAGMVWTTPVVVYGDTEENMGKVIAKGATEYKERVESLIEKMELHMSTAWW